MNDYAITEQPDGSYSVMKEDGTIYIVRFDPVTCTCPHHQHRLTVGQECKHHKIVKEKGAWNSGAGSPRVHPMPVTEKPRRQKKYYYPTSKNSAE